MHGAQLSQMILLAVILLFLITYLGFSAFYRRRLIEKALKQERILLQTLIDAIPSQSFYKDTQLRYLGCNKAFEKFAGKTRDQIIGKTISDIFKDGRSKAIIEKDYQFLKSSEHQIQYETSQTNALKENRDFFVIKTKFSNPDGSLGGFVTIFFDITDKKSLEKNLRSTTQQLTNKNIQIADSTRIQNAILREADELNEYFEEAFIFFRPKDIISGDFYWFGHREDLVLVAAADCTGHGVPGALLTILGHELLNQIVYEQGITRPDLILKTLDTKLKIALQKRDPEHEISDGMDIALVVVDKKNKGLQFSGARNPLYFIRDSKLEITSGSRYEIGGKSREKTFELHTRHFQEKDIFYIFSDGLQDQFGGPENRKLMVKGLQNLVLKIHSLPLAEQKQMLEEELKIWKKNHPQTDDILMIGMRPD